MNDWLLVCHKESFAVCLKTRIWAVWVTISPMKSLVKISEIKLLQTCHLGPLDLVT